MSQILMRDSSIESPSTLVSPRILCKVIGSGDGLECSVHSLPKKLLREFRHVFGDEYVNAPCVPGDTNAGPLHLIAVPTNQRAVEDLVAIGDHIEKEKDRLLNVFIDFARHFCEILRGMGYWADFIDPCSGLPMLTRDRNKVYSEVEGMEVLLNYKAHNAGCCKILAHPKWGSAVYPATIFAHCPIDVVKKLIHSYPDA